MKRDSYSIALAGNPNVGKTTIFNELTGGKQKIGNWPGVTVEKKTGVFKNNNIKYRVIDLPGIYSFSAHAEDEKVARDFVISGEVDLIINIVDATNLDRNLYLSTQLIEMKIPLIIILNKMDMAKKQNISIDTRLLQEYLKCPVIEMTAIKKRDIRRLREAIYEHIEKPVIPDIELNYPGEIESMISDTEPLLKNVTGKTGIHSRWLAIEIMGKDPHITSLLEAGMDYGLDHMNRELKKIEKKLSEEIDIIIADHRYGFIRGITKEVVKEKIDRQKLTDLIDSIVLNRFLGIPIFLGIMYLVFWVTINIGGAFIDFF